MGKLLRIDFRRFGQGSCEYLFLGHLQTEQQCWETGRGRVLDDLQGEGALAHGWPGTDNVKTTGLQPSQKAIHL
jgi:hypothetical protein